VNKTLFVASRIQAVFIEDVMRKLREKVGTSRGICGWCAEKLQAMHRCKQVTDCEYSCALSMARLLATLLSPQVSSVWYNIRGHCVRLSGIVCVCLTLRINTNNDASISSTMVPVYSAPYLYTPYTKDIRVVWYRMRFATAADPLRYMFWASESSRFLSLPPSHIMKYSKEPDFHHPLHANKFHEFMDTRGIYIV
jgi:hypothetical protein